MNEQQFKDRTKSLALRVIKLVAALPKNRVTDVIGPQLLRSATSVGANYRAACRGRSVADVSSKLAIVEEEGDETLCWIELLVEGGIMSQKRIADLQRETNEIVAMTVRSIKTLRERRAANRKSKI